MDIIFFSWGFFLSSSYSFFPRLISAVTDWMSTIKLVKRQHLLHMSSQYSELRPINGWDLSASLAHPGKIHFTAKSCVHLYWQRYCTALQQRASAKLCGVAQGTELVTELSHRVPSAGRPSSWAFAHILVVFILLTTVIMVALCNRADHYILHCGYFFLSFFSSPNLSRRRLDVYHTSTHGVALV